ncbi:MAG: AlkZ family DNA glycosylase [Micropruina sp.]|nr:AlkZ family DNA glycosylase [Micropruina sp.]
MRFPDEARRARLARRHALHPDHRLGDPAAVARAVVTLHATDPSTVHLAVAARMRAATVEAVERALYRERTLVKQLAMRRTLFAFPVELLPAVWGSASARVATQERARLGKDLERHGLAGDGAAWIDRGRDAVLARLADGAELSAQRLRQEIPEIDGRTVSLPGATRWQFANQAFAPRLLTVLGAEHHIVRGPNQGHWRTSRPSWTLMSGWLDAVPEQWPAADGYAELVRHWLARFGPGTENDLVWWLGATRSAVRAALAAVDAVSVELDGGATGYLLPGDEKPDDDPGEWAALLPVLDPTVMGWKERDFYLDPRLTPYLFDSNGNGGSTAWVNGRVVGCWVQDEAGRVRVIGVEPLPGRHRDLLEAEADRLTRFLDGVVIANVYKSRLMKGERLP